MKDTKKIFSSADFPVILAKTNDQVRARTFKCVDSGLLVISNYMDKPFSPITGGKVIPVDNKILSFNKDEMEKFEELGTCPSCHCSLVSHKKTADSLVGSKIHCTVCGEELMVNDTEEASDDLADTYYNKLGDLADDVEEKADDTEEPITTQIIEADEEIDNLDLDEIEDKVEDTREEVEDKIEEVESESEEKDTEEVESEEPAIDEIRVDMLSKVKAGLNTKKIDVVASGKDTFHYLMVANKPVATIHKTRATSEIKDIFSNLDLLTKAITASIEKSGINNQVISTFGLVPMILKVKANDVINQAVDKKVEEIVKSTEDEKVEDQEAYEQSIGIAAVGINRNVFSDVNNELAEDLIENLEQVGVEDAKEIVESSFAKHGEGYIRAILSKANEFKTKSNEVRNEIAATVANTKFRSNLLNLQHKTTASLNSNLKEKPAIDKTEVSRMRNKFFK